MRILKVVQAYYPFQEQGGPVAKVPALARGLVRRGHQVTVLTPDLGLVRHIGPRFKAEPCKWGWRAEQEGVEAVYLPTWLRHRALTLNPGAIGFCRGSLAKFDIAHFYGLYDLLGPAVAYSCRRRGIPYVIEPMGMYRPIDRSFRLKRIWRNSFGKAFWNGAARIIATSELEQQDLLDEGVLAHKILIRYNGIDPESFTAMPPRGGFRKTWKVPDGEPLILFLSRIIPRKGADILIESFAEACPKSGRLVIAGPEGERGYCAQLEACAKNAGVESRVIFTGPLYNENKKAAFVDSDLFALPSRYENFANAPAEAMACGVPVIISDACGIRTLVEGHAGMVIPPEKQALTEALRKMLGDKILYARFKEGCSRVASQLGWDRLTEQMEGYYAKVLAVTMGAP